MNIWEDSLWLSTGISNPPLISYTILAERLREDCLLRSPRPREQSLIEEGFSEESWKISFSFCDYINVGVDSAQEQSRRCCSLFSLKGKSEFFWSMDACQGQVWRCRGNGQSITYFLNIDSTLNVKIIEFFVCENDRVLCKGALKTSSFIRSHCWGV